MYCLLKAQIEHCILSGMIDTIGGSGKVNNFLATLNVKPIPKRNLQKMERRAGQFVEAVAETSVKKAAQTAFQQEMRYNIVNTLNVTLLIRCLFKTAHLPNSLV